LTPGERLGHFDVIDVLGSGGMGEVYRAHDTTLGRDVAIKVLPRALAADPQRMARFERESRILASLNHPHIAAIHSVEVVGGQRLLVLELVEGPTLANRLRAGPLSSAETLAVVRELAEALEAAHDRGIVHRDLKPANIKLTASSGLKLLDFGLAKERVAADAPLEMSVSDGTIDGVILGTCAYMSPEQARGKPVDRRTDIWAFGCILFEMLAGTRAFAGDTASDTMAAVLEREPDWSALPATTPPAVRRVLRRCLAKDPNLRLHDIADARLELAEPGSSQESAAVRPRSRAAMRAIVLLVAIAAGIVALEWWRHRAAGPDPAAGRTTRFTWTLPNGLGFDSAPTVSPDGALLAFTARPPAGPSRLYVRWLNQLDPHPVAGTEGAKQPFWSPDSRALAFFARGKLMKVALDGGAPVEISVAPDGRGGTWSPQGVIVFSPLLIEAGLMQVSENGGTAEPVTMLDVEQGENSHRWPVFLPDGVHFLYFVRALTAERRGVYLGRTDRPATTPGTPLFRSESEALYASVDGNGRGVLLTVANGRIEARPFDSRRRMVTGDPRALELPAGGNTLYHPMVLGVSADVLAHASTSIPFGVRLASIERNGRNPTLGQEREAQNWPRLSPDGLRLARTRIDSLPGHSHVWVEDLVRGTRVRVTEPPIGLIPVWAPDGARLAHVAGSVRRGTLTIAASDGTGVVATISCPGERCDPTDWSRDGRWLLATVYRERDQDVWLLPADGRGTAQPLLTQPFPERDARFSPDGRLVAYVSEESGRPEVSVQTIEAPRRRDVISVAGGDQPVWGPDGRELLLVDPQGLLRSSPVSVDASGTPSFGIPVRLDVPPIGSGHWGTQYDVSRDGRRIHFFDRRADPLPSEIGVVIGWRGLWK
jgi:Tol biopolymer transport system component